MNYKKAIVFFIDILGTKNITDFDILYKINTIFHESLQAHQEKDLPRTHYTRTVHTFSDCAYIIYDFKDDVDISKRNIAKLMKVALYNTEALINTFLINGFICRGGVTYGDIFYEKERSLFFGPAINGAYLLESKKAIYPRILIDNSIVEHINQLEQDLLDDAIKQNLSPFMIDNYKSINGEIIKKDEDDNLYFLNYLNKLKQGHNFNERKQLINSLNSIINNSVACIKNNIKNSTDDGEIKELNKILKKYIWLENFFKDSITPPCSNAAFIF